MIIQIANVVYKIEHQIKPEDFAPGIWAGTEGLEYVVTNVDLTNGIITLEIKEKV